ncbi:MAG TPA: hypothetical protein VFN25_11115 [Dokdonella sp.]|uniref:hypothetical protein n=1 Tax=Dokdonella sp. TaxID=2291710 RepID=UPI002D806BD3|nr:hypothetical protein [Dokdonella sp.]HET9033442.1 hypothetical protein [Dokdonella sp.]
MPHRWRNYALSSITPAFSWAPPVARDVPEITDTQTLADFSVLLQSLQGQTIGTLSLSVASQVVDGRAQALAGPQLDISAELPVPGLKRTIVAPTFTTQWGSGGSLGVTAILAYQRYASLGFGESSLSNGIPIWPVMAGETSYGAGLRFDAGSALTERVSWSAAYQSHVNMDAMNSLRGVYTDPGQFDIPASASVGVSFALTPSTSIDLGAQRVMYSEITPFTSPALPRRFLALLGSGASPNFAWDDLTVYSAGWSWQDARLGSFELRYTTGQQPSPSSSLLRNALDANLATRTIGFGYSRSTGKQASLSLQAIYSNAPYFLGVPSYRANLSTTGSQIEYQAAWGVQF